MKTLLPISVVLCAILCNPGAYAQFIDMSPVPDTTAIVGIKASRASFREDVWYGENPSSASGVYKLYGQFPMKDGWSFYAEVPFIFANQESERDNGLANIYVGFQHVTKAHPRTNVSFGIYLPTIGSGHYLRQEVGVMSDTYGVFQYAEGVTGRFSVAHHNTKAKGPLYGFEVGSNIFVPTYDGGKVEFLLHGAAKAGYAFGGFTAWGELNGFLPVSSDGYITDTMISRAVFGGQFMGSRVRPGLFYGIPLNGYPKEAVKGVLEIKVEFLLGR